MTKHTVAQMTVMAARAKTKVKRYGRRGITDVTFDEILALAFIADTVLEDFDGPMTRGDPTYQSHSRNPELEAL